MKLRKRRKIRRSRTSFYNPPGAEFGSGASVWGSARDNDFHDHLFYKKQYYSTNLINIRYLKEEGFYPLESSFYLDAITLQLIPKYGDNLFDP